MTKLADAYNSQKLPDWQARSCQSIRRQLIKLGEHRYRHWESEAEEYLLSIAGSDRVSELVARFNRRAKIEGWQQRSHNAIVIKLYRSGSDITPFANGWTCSELASLLNIIRHRIHKWIKNNQLKASHPKGRPEKGKEKSRLYKISLQDFRRFCQEYPHLLQEINLDKIAVVYGADRSELPEVLTKIKQAKNERGKAIQIMKVATLETFPSIYRAAQVYQVNPNKLRRIIDTEQLFDDSKWVTIGKGSRYFRVENW